MSAISTRTIIPLPLREANAFVKKHHRHHGIDRGAKFALGVANAETIVAVAIVGRPKARMLDDGFTAEVTRLCSIDVSDTDHAAPSCSMLYAACWRACRAMGYRKLVTYVLETEAGTTLTAAGWKCLGEAGGGTWSRKERPRVDTHPTQGKIRWEAAP